MKLYRARAWRTGPATFDPLDSSGSIGGAGWRFNDVQTEILYTAEVEALAILEVAVRPGWETVRQVLIGTIELPDGLVVEPRDLGIRLPSNWNARPVAPDSRSIAREFLHAIAGVAAASRPVGLRVPSVSEQFRLQRTHRSFAQRPVLREPRSCSMTKPNHKFMMIHPGNQIGVTFSHFCILFMHFFLLWCYNS